MPSWRSGLTSAACSPARRNEQAIPRAAICGRATPTTMRRLATTWMPSSAQASATMRLAARSSHVHEEIPGDFSGATAAALAATGTGVGAGVGIRNLVGNVAEYVLDVPAADQPEAKPVATDRFIEDHAAQIRVIGGSALSDPAIDPGQAQPLVLEEAKEGYADVGFRLCFSAGFAAGQTLAARVNRLIDPLPLIP